MKQRNALVSNSSSCSFMVYNKSNKPLTVVDFVKENPQLLELFKQTYDYEKNPLFNQEKMIENAEARLDNDIYKNYTIKPHGKNCWTFGDEDGDVIGQVYDYILRDGGKSKNFKWKLESMNR